MNSGASTYIRYIRLHNNSSCEVQNTKGSCQNEAPDS